MQRKLDAGSCHHAKRFNAVANILASHTAPFADYQYIEKIDVFTRFIRFVRYL